MILFIDQSLRKRRDLQNSWKRHEQRAPSHGPKHLT